MTIQDQPMSEVMEMLAGIANKHNLALSPNLIAFAEEVWMQGYEQGIKDEARYQEMKD